ncbi:unnamed protein product, partial [Amoebophrya sp. A120]|eukprot:GSA120T00010255001.1
MLHRSCETIIQEGGAIYNRSRGLTGGGVARKAIATAPWRFFPKTESNAWSLSLDIYATTYFFVLDCFDARAQGTSKRRPHVSQEENE